VVAFLTFLGVAAVVSVLNVFTLVLPRNFLKQRQQSKNTERQAFAMSQGWHFQPYAPELLNIYYEVAPFTERGDRRVAFGVLNGMVDGMPVTVFDYQRRTKKTSYSFVLYRDTNQVNTVWVVKLPAVLPPLQLSGRRFFAGNATQPQTPDQEFNQQHLIDDGDLNLARELFTPQVTGAIRHFRLSNWTILGNELIFPMVNVMTRTTPQEIMDTARSLVALVRTFPETLWQKYPAAPQTGPQPMPMPSQPMAMPQQMPQQPVVPQLLSQQPVSQPIPMAQPPMPQPMPQYGQQPPAPGYYPQQQPPPPGWGAPQPGYGPAPGYQQPPQGYPPRGY
jgi:hypothetical protein